MEKQSFGYQYYTVVSVHRLPDGFIKVVLKNDYVMKTLVELILAQEEIPEINSRVYLNIREQ